MILMHRLIVVKGGYKGKIIDVDQHNAILVYTI